MPRRPAPLIAPRRARPRRSCASARRRCCICERKKRGVGQRQAWYTRHSLFVQHTRGASAAALGSNGHLGPRTDKKRGAPPHNDNYHHTMTTTRHETPPPPPPRTGLSNAVLQVDVVANGHAFFGDVDVAPLRRGGVCSGAAGRLRAVRPRGPLGGGEQVGVVVLVAVHNAGGGCTVSRQLPQPLFELCRQRAG